MNTSNQLRIVGISGSLRKGSYNTALLHAAAELMPPEMTLEIIDISPLPMLNQDFEKPFPEVAAEFCDRLAKADGVLFATPEYNSSISAVLKNAIDWASRSPQQPLNGKPAAIIGASIGIFGTARAQSHLRQVLSFVGALTLNKPEVLVGQAHRVFDSEGKLTDEIGRGFLRDLLVAFAQWIRQVSPT